MTGTERLARVCPLALLLLVLPSPLMAAGSGVQPMPSEAVFLIQLVLLLVCGRLLGEGMQRIGQPAVMGQLIAGILLGPSVLGALWPDLQHSIFPGGREQRSMIDAIAQLGILMLLLLTGMETDLSLAKRSGRAAFGVSITGISIPFLCGFVLGKALPDAMLPHPGQRLITALFLGTALSISSVKIVAMTVREMNFMRRNLGQLIVTAAIIDDTIGWTILAITLGLATHGRLDLLSLARSVFGVAIFLVVSFSLGRRAVALLIRWANDTLVSEVPVITAILVVMGLLALATEAIGVHTVLGAFVAGILVGQSPILTRHIDEQLRGLVIALFMPVFFGLAGLNTDLRVLADPALLLLSLGLIAIASIGKFCGAFLGGAFGGLTWRESVALGCGMNARGSTEVVVASIGLSAGVLSQDLYTMIVAMAVVTTMAMPPMLRWALLRLPLRPEEEMRLKYEGFEARCFVTKLERLLVATDGSASGHFALCLAGLLAVSRRIPITILSTGADTTASRGGPPVGAGDAGSVADTLAAAMAAHSSGAKPGPPPMDVTTRVLKEPMERAVVLEARKGYSLLVIGVEAPAGGGAFDETIARIAASFDGPFAIALARGVHRDRPREIKLDILVPVSGTRPSRRGAEVALALARASHGSVTALHVTTATTAAKRSWRHRIGPAWGTRTNEAAILQDIARLGDQLGVRVKPAVRTHATAEEAILQQLRGGTHNLIVMGGSPGAGTTLSFGDVAAAVLERSSCSVLLVSV